MLTRKLFRTAWNYKAQFISMIIMITLGIGIFLGFNMEWYTIEYDTSRFFVDTNYADYRLYTQDGFTADDLDKISAIDGIRAATRFFSVNLDLKGKNNRSLVLDVSENYTVSTFVVAGEYEMKLMLGPLTYCVSILLTFGVSLLVGLMVAGKNKRIDMVEALKTAD